MGQPLVSIVTVVYNAVDGIEKTITSILSQITDSVTIEYWIIDGGSTDGTLEIIDRYSDCLNYISTPDKGIYDAMNKGLECSKGSWVLFMNAGDVFLNSSTVDGVFSQTEFFEADVVYGNCIVDYGTTEKVRAAGDVQKLWKGSCFSHQSAFIDLSYHKLHPYNINNRIAADFEFFYKLFLAGGRFIKTDKIIGVVTAGGVSDINRVDAMVAWWNCVNKSNGVNFYYIKIILLEMLKGFVKNVIRRMRRKI
ncbi:glycosyltransferase family 2 protein [Pseudomonas veronii]|uniref:Glycosyltransferase n=1 Tax=Pseudomonas veronii TaxID=76761 RepID=A0A4V1DC12_PSEVE|nr:glycosyltransferase family 2 protein [Pseudomonas veronii]QCG68506.2 glycosyltransferase [Pseudomonas veronii]